MSTTVTFDAADDAVAQCPYDHYRNMRDGAPVLELDGAALGRLGETVYAVTRHEDVKRILHDPTTFSSKFGGASAKPSPELTVRLKEVMADGWPSVSTLLTEDPPSHTRYRRLVSMAFTPRRVALLEPALRQICEDLVTEFEREPRVDFLTKFAVPLPVAAVATILEIPDTRRDDFKRWADSSVAAIGRAISDDERVAAERDILDQQHYFVSELELRRNEPHDDFLTDLLNAELAPGDDLEGGPLDIPEMLSIIRQIQVAGSETTASLLSDLIVQLAQHPDEWEKLKADPSRAAKVVEEGLRWASPNQGLFRIVMADTEVAGTPIPKGSTVWISYGSADHDDRVFDEPEEFNPDRERLNSHIAFGHGIHFCLGAALARLEAVTALKVLASRLDTISVVDPDELRYGSSFILRGLEYCELDVTYQ
ncbi:cytochrome P450 [Ilumatobacter sp.]|uniref:cytochrome P450 n=1 Tax=Ilumatobacter sp. TaxID=1967498 RepID=UPI003C60A023